MAIANSSFSFADSHDQIAGPIKQKVHQEISYGKNVIENTQQFATAVEQLCDITDKYFSFNACFSETCTDLP